jgi:hypothetical protein
MFSIICSSIKILLLEITLWGPHVVAHTYNPIYLGGRDQEDHGLRPIRAKN